ncbi:MAG: periplasmic divalent cation tolerance protein [archaeon GW2011_AR5]|nr:MAG: periplasmic divalent cation tolerance protein [archaeon GW2011_AR5]
MPLIFVYVTNPNRKEAKKLAVHLIKKKLAACANIFPIDSVYPWKGKIAEEKEFVLVLKTKNRNYAKIAREVENMHSYDIPCIIKIPIKANKKYGEWLESCLKQ